MVENGNDEVTFTVDEKDGTLTVKGDDGEEIRYVKEADLLAVKGSKESFESELKKAESNYQAAVKAAENNAEAERQKVLQAEAKISSLEEKIASGGGSAAELEKATADLEAAKKSSEVLGNKFLELRRTVIATTYGVPKETVESKNLEQLDVYEEALKSIAGAKNIGNFAVGGGGGVTPDSRTAKEKIQSGWSALHPNG